MMDRDHKGYVKMSDFKRTMTDDICHPADLYLTVQEMLCRKSTYAVTGYVCGTLTSFASRPEVTTFI